jgi:hypothetical protein
MARLTSEDDSGGLPASPYFAPTFEFGSCRSFLAETHPWGAHQLGGSRRKAALSADKAIVNSEGSSFEQAHSRVALANTQGSLGPMKVQLPGFSADRLRNPRTVSNAITG